MIAVLVALDVMIVGAVADSFSFSLERLIIPLILRPKPGRANFMFRKNWWKIFVSSYWSIQL